MNPIQHAVKAHLESGKVDEGHDIRHAMIVQHQSEQAVLELKDALTEDEKLAVSLAGLGHDLDDPKFFIVNTGEYIHAKRLLNQFLSHMEDSRRTNIINLVIEMISYVSASENGNDIPERAKTYPWLLIPRYADRLEAIGDIGLVRAYIYAKYKGNPMYTENTPRPRTRDEVKMYATPERFLLYSDKSKKLTSPSVMDHIYDKLLHIGFTCGNTYLDAQVEARMNVLYDTCLYFGEHGHITDDYFLRIRDRIYSRTV